MKLGLMKQMRDLSRLLFYGILCQCLLVTLLLARDGSSQDMLSEIRISIDLQNAKLLDVFVEIEQASEMNFVFIEGDIDSNALVSISMENQTMADVLTKISKLASIRFRRINRDIYVTSKEDNDEALVDLGTVSETITGRVVDENNEPLPGTSIILKGTSKGTIADINGEYVIEAPLGEILTFSFVGYKLREEIVTDQTIINVSMVPDASELEEIVVIGYGTQARREVSGSVTAITAADLGEVAPDVFGRSLNGKVAGVQVQQTTGAPGGSIKINIRGATSVTSGSGPLYVVDGFPIDQTNDGEGADQGFNPLSSLDANDIETINVLKDASATAIYGSRGAGGVVIITTKKGKQGKTKISFNRSIGIQSVIRKLDLLNGEQLIDLIDEAHSNAGLTAPNFLLNKSLYLDNNTDWQDEIFRNAIVQQYQLSASGGDDRLRYFISGSYLDEEGIVVSSAYERFSLRSNFDAKLSDCMSVGLTFSPSYSIQDDINAEGSWSSNGVINSALVSFPFLRNDQSNYAFLANDANFASGGPVNPRLAAEEYSGETSQLRLLSNLFLEMELIKGLTLRTSIGIDWSEQERNEYAKWQNIKRELDRDSLDNRSSAKRSKRSWLAENTLKYSHHINDHSFQLLAGYSIQEFRQQRNAIASRGQSDGTLTITDNVSVTSATSRVSEWSLISYISRFTYSFRNKLFVNGSLRRDGSSRFGEGSQFGLFPAISGAYSISEEPFLRAFDPLSELKLRASFGRSGNNQIGNYTDVGLLVNSNYLLGTGNGNEVSGAHANNIGNKSLTWETTDQLDLGIDLGLFADRIFIEADYYNGITKDMLLQVPIPVSSGFETAIQNIGRVQTSGFEFTLNTRNLVNDFEWSTNFNISFNKNKVLELGPNSDPIFASSGKDINFKTEVGGELGAFFLYEQIGIFQNQNEIDASATWENVVTRPGDVKFKDHSGPNGFPDGIIDEHDKVIMGSNRPDFIWGLTNNFRYKNFDLNVVVSGVQGNEIHNAAKRFYNNLEGNQNQVVDALYRWKSEAEPGDGVTPRANRSTTGKSNETASSRWLEDGSYIKIQDVTLGYDLPKKITSKIKVTAFRAYVSASNLFYFTDYSGYNPEVSFSGNNSTNAGVDYGTYPLARRLTLGIKIDY